MSRQRRLFFPLAVALLVLTFFGTLKHGAVETSWVDVLGAFTPLGEVSGGSLFVRDLRLPRALLAVLVGAGLAVSGTAMQGLFRNPLADPSLTGVSAGAAAGAVTVIVAGSGVMAGTLIGKWAVAGAALGGSLLATLLVYRLAHGSGAMRVTTLLLAGIAVNAMGAAYMGWMVYLADYGELRDFVYWSLGSLAQTGWVELFVLIPFVGIPLVYLVSRAGALNAFLLGEDAAFHLGVDIDRLKRHLVFACAALVGGCVALCGIISFVGLLVPHLVRGLVGADHRRVIAGSAVTGAVLLLLGDMAARALATPAELPLGIFTALSGGPFFLYLVFRNRFSMGG